ncbi:MAG TPA: family 16 glycoside hydrolase [Planctomicrobium sp.]|nr:family 16 glycoside hydrolase [Planctomicrobium sp.]
MQFSFRVLFCLLILSGMVGIPVQGEDRHRPLFDGISLTGWKANPQEQHWWRAENGILSGGSLTETVPENTFLATTQSFQNFDLKLQIRIQGAGGFINSGIQIRSVRVPDSSEMSGYQVDAGDGWWGKLYDESRRNKVIGEAKNLAAVNSAIRVNDWNSYRIRAEGRRIQTWINEIPALDYLEEDHSIPFDGHIGIQVHGGGKALVQVKDIEILELAPTPGAPTWKLVKEGKAVSEIPVNRVRSPEQERSGFHVPEGFEVELVASESETTGKFISIAFDAVGRLWTMTALEYPIDGNENPKESEQAFAAGGRDQVLVIDQPFTSPPSPPRVFADGLVIPLGILPYQNGVYVQYGNDIRYYRDTNGDGRADEFEVVLTGFGTQDSHLFPHQFTRLPGGEIFIAQGLFNYSKVRRGNGQPFVTGEEVIPFDQCKTAVFSLTGDRFDVTSSGLNNIWGLSISRTGDVWMQEANDIGHPVTPYYVGSHYPTGGRQKLRPYQPTIPPTLTPPQMGGTGLSGLALADDRDGWPSPWGIKDKKENEPLHFYLANPITCRLQHVTATKDQNGDYHYEKQADFLTSDDPNFRPVALQFGPDGCLYFVDWYNKVISHNEVPRNHPERDKTHGRIWRIRHQSQSKEIPTQLSKLTKTQLLNYLGADNNRLADLAWQELVDRQAHAEVPALHQLILDSNVPVDRRLGALWAMEGLGSIPPSTLQSLAESEIAPLQRESIRIAARQYVNEQEFLLVAEPLLKSSVSDVRFALGNALRRLPEVGPRTIQVMLQLSDGPESLSRRAAYDRAQERCLVRWGLERHPEQVTAFLQSPQGNAIPVEVRLFAFVSLGGRSGAVGIARSLPELKRSLEDEEIRVLTAHLQQPEVNKVMQNALRDPLTSHSTLAALKRLRTEIQAPDLLEEIALAVQELWKQPVSDEDRLFLLETTAEFRVQSMDKPVADFAASGGVSRPVRIKALQALREIGTSQVDRMKSILAETSDDLSLQDEILTTLAESPVPEAFSILVEHLPAVPFHRRSLLIERLASNLSGAKKLIEAVRDGDLEETDFSVRTLETLKALLPDDPEVQRLWSQVSDQLQQVLSLPGGNQDYANEPITLNGLFTVESWLRLGPGITNRDGLLGKPGLFDWNFAYQTSRLFVQGRDVIVAKTKALPDVWTHYALTRDDRGILRLYLNGELNVVSDTPVPESFSDLRIGRTTPGDQGTHGEFVEYRVWNVTRSGDEIRATFDQRFSGKDQFPGLTRLFAANDWGVLNGAAKVASIVDGPKLLNSEQARLQEEKFAAFRRFAQNAGNGEQGRILFQEKCLVCHSQGGQGGGIGPALDGTGHRGIEAMLRNVLTPSAAMEGGYRNFRVLTRNGRVLNGLLLSQNDSGVVLRSLNTPDQHIRTAEIDRAEFTADSVMPEGLLESMTPQQVSDLFTYLMSLK